MNTRILLIAGILTGAATVPVHAQDANKGTREEATDRRFWQAELPGGAYIVALDRISAVGKHEYLVDGGFVVTEVTIDTVGSVVARFYFGEQFKPEMPGATGQAVNRRVQEVIETVKERTRTNQTDRLVVKNYPTTTHARTIEFRLNEKQNLEALFQSVNRAWITGKGVRFTVQVE